MTPRLIAALYVASAFADPPSVREIAKRAAARETESAKARDNFTYRQSLTIEEMDTRGARAGEYSEVRDVLFDPKHERTEKFIGKPKDMLKRLKLTPEDFRDVRDIQNFLFTADVLRLYQLKDRGEERIEEGDCYVIDVSPKQLLDGQRLFEGTLWIAKDDFSILRSFGRAVPQIFDTKTENLFPQFTTYRAKMPNGFWFPVRTFGDDVLPFRNGPIRQRMTIKYTNYQEFKAESNVKFEPKQPD